MLLLLPEPVVGSLECSVVKRVSWERSSKPLCRQQFTAIRKWSFGSIFEDARSISGCQTISFRTLLLISDDIEKIGSQAKLSSFL